MIDMSYEQAVALLKKAVKFSNIKNQKHIDLTLVNAPELPQYQNALMVVKSTIDKGEKTQEEVNATLGVG